MIKSVIKKIKGFKASLRNKTPTRKEVEDRVSEGATKALKEYRRTFEKLAEYDRT